MRFATCILYDERWLRNVFDKRIMSQEHYERCNKWLKRIGSTKHWSVCHGFDWYTGKVNKNIANRYKTSLQYQNLRVIKSNEKEAAV